MTLSGLIDAFRPADTPPPQTLRAFILWCLSGTMPVLWLGAVVSMAAGLLEVGTATLLGMVIDSALESGVENFFASNLWLLVFVTLFFVVLRPLLFGSSAAIQGIAIGPNLNPLVLSRLHRHTIGQAVTFFDEDFAGRIAQKQMQTSRAVTDIAVEVINVVAFAIASMIGSVLLLTTIGPTVAVLLVIWLVFYLWMIRAFMPLIRKNSRSRAATRAMVTGQIVDTVTNIKTVQLFAHGEHEDQAALGAMEQFRTSALAFGRVSTAFRFSLMALAGLLPVLLVGSTLYLWTQDVATTGDIVAAGAISIRIGQMTGWVSFTLMGIYANIGETEDGMRTLAPAHTLVNQSGANDLEVVDGQIDLDRVSFHYGRDIGGLSDVSLTVNPGEKLGLVGASGAGKSTLVSLLLRLYDPEKGAVVVDGQDLRDVTMESLRGQIGIVTQETAMFNRSARDNILYGRPCATEAEMMAAAERAEAHEFIQDLQDLAGRKGYDAHLGERGVKLSGGQRQRIALARAILKDAPILVLDEATSALDSEVEALIQSALAHVMEGKTVIAIAHRLSTIAKMDRIVVMANGSIVEQGTHSELLALKGHYARFWDRQSGGFIGVDEIA